MSTCCCAHQGAWERQPVGQAQAELPARPAPRRLVARRPRGPRGGCHSRWLHTTKGRSQTSDGHLSCSVTGQTPKDGGCVFLTPLSQMWQPPSKPPGSVSSRRTPLDQALPSALALSCFSLCGCWPRGPLPRSPDSHLEASCFWLASGPLCGWSLRGQSHGGGSG